MVALGGNWSRWLAQAQPDDLSETETLSDGQRGASGLLFGIDRDVP